MFVDIWLPEIWMGIPEAYLESYFIQKSSIVDVRLGSKYNSELNSKSLSWLTLLNKLSQWEFISKPPEHEM